MKRSDLIDKLSIVMVWVLPVLLLVPNAILCITEHYTWATIFANLLLPAAVYLLLMALSQRTGRTALLMLPFMVLAAFQIVLIFLYGEAIIAIDMFLNVVSTNVGEATELLSTLVPAIVTVCAIYLPPIVVAIYLCCRRARCPQGALRAPRFVALWLLIGGLVALVFAGPGGLGTTLSRRIFPVNVICNMFTAAERTRLTEEFPQASANYRFYALPPDSTHNQREIFVVVVGETGRADNWQLFGYDRPTNPRLSRRSGLVAYPHTLSESNTTHKSVPLLLTPVSAQAFGDSIYSMKGLPAMADEAGFETAWISAQQHSVSLIEEIGRDAHIRHYICDTCAAPRDIQLAECLRKVIADADTSRSLMVVLHCYGSHFDYRERYTGEYSVFKPDEYAEATEPNRQELLNAYDNTVLYTDAVLDGIIDVLDSAHCPTAMIYAADHGEDIFDDSRGRFLHASPTPTYWQLHVPMLLWVSPEYAAVHPAEAECAQANAPRQVASSRSLFHTVIGLSGIQTPVYHSYESLVSPDFREPDRVFLDDYDEAVPLTSCGLRINDYAHLAAVGISAM